MPKPYDKKALDDAVQAVRSGECSLRKAALHYGIPKSTVQDHVHGNVQEGRSAGRQTALPAELELQMASKIQDAAEKGFGISRAQLAIRAARVATLSGVQTPWVNGIPGKDWIDGFRKRHKLNLYQPIALSSIRSRILNKPKVQEYFNDLENLMDRLELKSKPHCVWNMDETHSSLTHKPGKVLSQRGSRNVPGRVGNDRDSVSVLCCINAAGGTVPPLCIVKGKTPRCLNAYDTTRGPTNAKYTYQEKAYMIDLLGEMWFRDHFLKFCGSERPQLIILDSHSSHETLGLLTIAQRSGIHLFALPPHTTHWLCPLDKTVFGPLSRKYQQDCTLFMSQSPNHLVTKWEWPKLFNQAYSSAFSIANIQSGFRQCGVVPLNPQAIPASAFAPSLVYDDKSRELESPETSVESASDFAPLPNDNSSTETDQQETTCIPPRVSLPEEPFREEQAGVSVSQESVSLLYEARDPADGTLEDGNMPTAICDPLPSIAGGYGDALLAAIAAGNYKLSPDGDDNYVLELPPEVENDLISMVGTFPTASSPITSDSSSVPLPPTSTPSIVSITPVTPTDFDNAVNEAFHIDNVKLCQDKKCNKRKLTSHRLLTSDEIIEKKLKEEEDRVLKEREKQKRKEDREIKKKEKEQKKFELQQQRLVTMIRKTKSENPNLWCTVSQLIEDEWCP